VSFGALAVAAGLSRGQACALSLLMFTGGSQFAFVGIIATGGAGLAAIATAALLGVRNALYSLQLVPLLRAGPATPAEVTRRAVAAHLTIDESTAVALAQTDPQEQRLGFWVTGLAVFVLWNVSTAVGAGLGDVLGDPRRYGLDGAAAAAFLALLWPRIRARPARVVAAIAAAVAIVLTPLTPAGVPVLAAAAVAAGVALVRPPAAHPGGSP
jgi:predicted branched-subunit amino acid permease